MLHQNRNLLLQKPLLQQLLQRHYYELHETRYQQPLKPTEHQRYYLETGHPTTQQPSQRMFQLFIDASQPIAAAPIQCPIYECTICYPQRHNYKCTTHRCTKRTTDAPTAPRQDAPTAQPTNASTRMPNQLLSHLMHQTHNQRML